MCCLLMLCVSEIDAPVGCFSYVYETSVYEVDVCFDVYRAVSAQYVVALQ